MLNAIACPTYALPPRDRRKGAGQVISLENARMKKERMTREQFEAVRPLLPKRMKDESISLAFDVLVEGVSVVEAATQHGLSKQRGHVIVDRVLSAAKDVPKGTQRVNVFLPKELAPQVKAMTKAAFVGKDRMDAERFAEVRAMLPRRMKQASIDLAYDVLVNGVSIPEAVDRHGLTRQRGRVIVNRVLAAAQGAPASWVRVDGMMTPADASKVEKMVKDAHQQRLMEKSLKDLDND